MALMEALGQTLMSEGCEEVMVFCLPSCRSNAANAQLACVLSRPHAMSGRAAQEAEQKAASDAPLLWCEWIIWISGPPLW